jgi:hypothetical protein
VGPPDSNRFRSGLVFGGGRPDAGGVGAGVDPDADFLAEPASLLVEPGSGVLGGADASHSSTLTVHVAFADPMLR